MRAPVAEAQERRQLKIETAEVIQVRLGKNVWGFPPPGLSSGHDVDLGEYVLQA